MSYSALTVANEFIKLSLTSGEPKFAVTNMKLQKLVYISHGYYLGLRSVPLIKNDIHAFEWGPVIPILYSHLKVYGAARVDKTIASDLATLNSVRDTSLINSVWRAYGHYDGMVLSRITHRPNTPWSITWESNKHGVIDNTLIRDHYRKLLDERRGITPATTLAA